MAFFLQDTDQNYLHHHHLQGMEYKVQVFAAVLTFQN